MAHWTGRDRWGNNESNDTHTGVGVIDTGVWHRYTVVRSVTIDGTQCTVYDELSRWYDGHTRVIVGCDMLSLFSHNMLRRAETYTERALYGHGLCGGVLKSIVVDVALSGLEASLQVTNYSTWGSMYDMRRMTVYLEGHNLCSDGGDAVRWGTMTQSGAWWRLHRIGGDENLSLRERWLVVGWEGKVHWGLIIWVEEDKLLNDDPSSPLPPKELHVEELKIIKSSIDDPPELELKDLPSHLEYAFLEGADKLPVIIAKNLKEDEKVRLLKVLKSHKRAIT
ncbi:hypothetical protein Tco_0862909 [Tanacetum coccineum]